MSEQRIIRHSRTSSRCGAAAVLAAVAVLSAASCQIVIGDLPPEATTRPKDSGAPERAPSDATPADTTADVVTPRDAFDAPADAADAEFDAPVDAADATIDPCTTPVLWYPDADKDGYGRPDTAVSGCPKPAGSWSRVAGDCYDGDARVHPGQTAYFGTPYPRGDAGDSFDFDCSGIEEPNPGQARLEGCGLLSLTLCEGFRGYAKGSRSGAGIDGFCGSTTLIECHSVLLTILVCEPSAQTVADEPYRCR